MEKGLVPVELKDIDAGIQAKSSDLAIDGEFQRFPLTSGMKNWSFGKRKGMTTRYGIAPVPGHNSSDNSTETTRTVGSLTGYKPFNLIAAEGSLSPAHPSKYDSFRNTYDVYEKRKSILGAVIISQTVQPRSNEKDYPVMHWLTMRERSKTGATQYQMDFVPSTKWGTTICDGQEIVSQYEATVGGGGATIATDFTDFGAKEIDVVSFALNNSRLMCLDPVLTRQSVAVKWYTRFTEHKYNVGVSFNAFASIANAVTTTTQPDPSVFASLGFPYIMYNNSVSVNSAGVTSLAVQTGFKAWAANVNISKAVAKAGDMAVSNGWIRLKVISGLTTLPYVYSSGKIESTAATLAWTAINTVAPAAYFFQYWRHEEYQVSLGIQMVAAIVDGKPCGIIRNKYIQDKTESILHSEYALDTTTTNRYQNDNNMWLNLTENIYATPEFPTLETEAATFYKETFGSVVDPRKTCWTKAVPYVAGTATSSVIANKGILESNRSYEYAYSVVNKMTGVESNVGTPASVFTGATANGGILINGMLPSTEYLQYITKDITAAYASNTNLPQNYFSFKLYYREVGSFEWLYSGEVPFVDDGLCPAYDIYIGESNCIGLPGPQAGAYIDNSPLPNDNYLDVVSFAGKLWWIAKDAIRFSSSNALTYPIRNYIASSSGEFLGAKAHFFSGQAEARARLVVFGTKSTYDVRQTSEFQYMQVQVSASSPPQSVPIPDTNIIVSERSSHTAFSGRTAEVAEGILYYWGPTGIFRDDGVNLPVRISDSIEPDLFDCFDKTKTDEFFAYYNKKAQEILFFYRPITVVGGVLTKAWVYSIRTEDFASGIAGAWTQYEYTCLIDWAQDLDINKFYGARIGDTVEMSRAAGHRTMIGARASTASTVSRPYFHDDLCDCGDMTPGTEMMVASVSRTNATTVRLTFTTDHNASILSGAAVASTVYIFGSQEYGKLAVSLDGLREVVGKGAGYLDIKDSSAYAGPDTLSMRSFFPVFFSTHDVPCVIATNFFAPFGTASWSRFRYSHLLIQPTPKYAGTVQPTASIAWNCNHTLSTSTTKTITVDALNTRERTSQIVFDMASPGMQSEGQGVELGVTYNQRGPRWSLFAWTLWTAPSQGARNLLTYEQ